MKLDTRLALHTLVLVTFVFTGCATVPEGSVKLQQQSERMVPPDGKAGVYIFRPSLLAWGSGTLSKVEIDSKIFGYLAPRTYLYGIVPPGEHSVGISDVGMTAVTFNAKEGTNHYFKLSLLSFTLEQIPIVPIEAAEARQLINEFTLSKYNIFEYLQESDFGAISTKPTDSNVNTTPQEEISTYKFDDYTKAYAFYRPLAEQGDVEAQLILSRMYSEGLGVVKDDLKAIEWQAIAVEEGDAAIRRGFDLQLGNILKDAEKGDATAQFKLGIIYNNGWGVPADIAEATEWYRKAAEQGHAASKDMLRTTFFTEEGICTNTKYKFEAKAPEGWNVNSIAPGEKTIRGHCEFMKKGTSLAPVISITIDPLTDYMLNYSLPGIAKYMQKSWTAIEIIEQPNEVQVNTLPASKTAYEMSGFKVMLYQFRKENLIITIQLMDRSSTFESNIEDFQKTLNSFKYYQ